jgi:hypothetical protein
MPSVSIFHKFGIQTRGDSISDYQKVWDCLNEKEIFSFQTVVKRLGLGKKDQDRFRDIFEELDRVGMFREIEPKTGHGFQGKSRYFELKRKWD